MRFRRLSVYSVLAAITLRTIAKPLSLPRWGDMRTKHSWNTVPKNWEFHGHPPNGTTIDLYVALKPHRESALIDALHEVSDPNHPRHVSSLLPLLPSCIYSRKLPLQCRYGAHLTKEQVADLVAPRPGTLELVDSWLRHHGVPSSSISLTHAGTTLTLSGVSMTQANALLGTSYRLYRHVKTNEIVVRTIGYSLPAALHVLVQTVAPTTCFDSPGRHTQWQSPRERYGEAEAGQASGDTAATVLSSRDDDDDDESGTRPAFLRWLYSTYAYTPAAIPPTRLNMLGIMGIRAEYPNPKDLTKFMGKYRTDGADAKYTVVQISGGRYDPSHPGREASLDTQYAMALGYPTPLVYYSIGRGPSGTDDYFFSLLGYLLSIRNIPQTISMSFGLEENIMEDGYAEYLCRGFGILGVLGVSVLSGSGDNGVGSGGCVTEIGTVQFQTLFPAACKCGFSFLSSKVIHKCCSPRRLSGPWVTAVGGTTGHTPEVAAGISGGGFSNIFERPAYQQQALSPFFQHLGDRYHGMYKCVYFSA